MKVELFKDRQGKWRWRFKSRNGRIPGRQGFDRKSNAKQSALAAVWDIKHHLTRVVTRER